MSLSFIRTGQQGILVQSAETGIRFGIDLFLTRIPERKLQNIVEVEDLSDVALLFGTHDHLDHIDRDAWKKAAKLHKKLRFVAPRYFEATLPEELSIPAERFLFVDENETVSYEGIDIQAVAAAHEFLDTSEDGLHPYLIYIVTVEGKKLCHMGDTCLYEGIYGKLRALGPFDVMFLPINGRDAVRYRRNCIGNMTYQEAADLAGTLKPALAVPGHYDMFADNAEDPEAFLEYVNIKYPGQTVRVLEPGETCMLPE